MNNQVYCTAPFNGISINQQGKVRTCCRGQSDILDLNKEPIINIRQNKLLKEIQESMLKGVPHPTNCENCAYHEKITGDGIVRNWYNNTFSEIDHDNLKLKSIEVRWNNLCNLSCVYCTPDYSSIWESKLAIPIKTPKVKNYQDEVLEWILNQMHHVQELQLVGGEPMLMKQNYALIEVLPPSSRLIIITNLSYDLPNIPCMPDLLKRPQENTNWHVSIDNVKQQFEYVRNGASWDIMESNLHFLAKHWPNNVSISFVYNVFSAFDILETVQTIEAFGFKKFQLVGVMGHRSLNVLNMPKEIKKIAAERLSAAIKWHNDHIHIDDRDLYPFVGAQEILKKLESESQDTIVSKADFFKDMEFYDKWNQIPFAKLWPEVMDLVNLHLH